MLVLLAAVVTGAVAQTHEVTLKAGTVDASNWTISPTVAAADATVTATYFGEKKVKSVKAVKKTVPPTFPIALSAVTKAYIGSVVTADGYVYATTANAAAASKTAVAMIIYVSSSTTPTHDDDNGVDYKCLALALADESGTMNWEAAKTACSTTKNTSTPVTNAKWMLPSTEQWQAMGATEGSSTYGTLRDGFASVGGENMQPASYWSSTPASSFVADYYSFISGSWGNDGEMDNSDNYRVRACLAF